MGGGFGHSALLMQRVICCAGQLAADEGLQGWPRLLPTAPPYAPQPQASPPAILACPPTPIPSILPSALTHPTPPPPLAVHSALLEPGSGYPEGEVAAAVRHTPAQVRTLLGVV